MIDRVTAVRLISSDPRALADFYRNALGLPLEDEEHPGVPLHYGCDIGGVHLAIHSSGGFTGVPARPCRPSHSHKSLPRIMLGNVAAERSSPGIGRCFKGSLTNLDPGPL